MRHTAGYIKLSQQQFERLLSDEAVWERLERTACNYEAASAEDRADLGRVLAVIDAREDEW